MRQFTAEQLLDPRENITVQRVVHTQDQEVHTHDFLEIVYILQGAGVQNVGGREYRVQRGDLLFINYGQTHAFRPEGALTYYNILLKPEFLGEELMDAENAFSLLSLTAFEDFRLSREGMGSFCAFRDRELPEVEAALQGMYREFCRKEAGYRTVLRGYLTVVLAKLFRKMALPESGGEKRQKAIAPELLAYIEEHCCEKLGLSDLARRCFYNPSYFSRVFRQETGETFSGYLNRLRIERSKELLRHKELRLTDIAQMVGFEDQSYFTKVFKKLEGVTPLRYRSGN